MVDVKTEIGVVDGTPDKRLFWSIIADYDLRTGICELVDNALDMWVSGGRSKDLRIAIDLSVDRQLITVIDNAGGVAKEHLRFLVAPGGSRNDPSAPVIGIFGVGSKRAGVALGEIVEIRTRFKTQQTFAIEVTPEWLESSSWEIKSYAVPDIEPGTTRVHISHLRKPLSGDQVDDLANRLGETYEWFISRGCVIEVNGIPVPPRSLENWAFPPDHVPQRLAFEAAFGKDGKLNIEIIGGLIADRDPEGENYGVCFYCNERLIAAHVKERQVGYYITSEAGVPHPDASLCRVIVRLNGPARLMPWTSNKTGINFDSPIFESFERQLIQLVSYFSKLSRRMKDDWKGMVFDHATGPIADIDFEQANPRAKLILPPLPRGNLSRIDDLKKRNAKAITDTPWTLGLVEAIATIDLLTRQRFETRNRIALIILDSNFEIALKEFIVHRTDLFPAHVYNDAKIALLFKNRSSVIAEVEAKVPALKPHLAKASHYYLMRNKLIHERATVGISDADVANYRLTVQAVLTILFQLKFPR